MLLESTSGMMSKSILTDLDLTDAELQQLFSLAAAQKAALRRGERLPQILQGKTVGMLFEKPSLRTRVSFEVGVSQLGGHSIFLGAQEVQLGKREAIKDFARVICRYVDLIVARVFKQEHLEEMARESRVPVINALSDYLHPCQALGDFLTIREHFGDWAGRKLAFVGDGNNVARSLALLAARLGVRYVLAAPEGYGFTEDFLAWARQAGRNPEIAITHDPLAAVADADIVYTDVWTSMGQEAEAETRRQRFRPFQVNAQLMTRARPEAIFMHCLPAHRGEEVTDEVMDGPHAVVYDQAENRLHAQRALMTMLFQ